MTALSARQAKALGAIREYGADGITAPELAALLDTSPEGAAMTAASLVRRGEVRRRRTRNGAGVTRVRWAAR